MHPTPYQELNQVLDELVARIRQLLGDDLVGAYLQGSFAVGDFDEHSDVDFVVVVEYNLLPDQLAALQVMHDRIYALDSQWAQHLEGSYFPREILRDPAPYTNRFYQGYIVLNYCRMLHDLHRGYPGSKREGAEWAKSALDPSWSDLIDRAWDTRPDPAKQVRQPADPEDFRKTLKLVEHVMQASRAYVSRGDDT